MSNINRRTLLTAAPIAAVAVLLAVACYVQGSWSERWGTFPELQLYAKRLSRIPTEFGEWKGDKGEKSDEKILKIAGAEGEFICVYKDPAGNAVRVSIICARLRDIFYHTPDRCYPAAGFEMLSEPQQQVFESGDRRSEFFTTTFEKSEPTGTHKERGYWSWSAGDKWFAPKNYKLTFSGQKALYKLYVFAAVPTGSKKTATHDDFCADFIRTFMPVLEDALGDKANQVAEVQSPAKPAG